MKNPPAYDPKKDYFAQSREVLEFYMDEERKIKEGTIIGGYYMHPWLYFHINYFKTPIPTLNSRGKSDEIIKIPELDDNFLYINETYSEAEKQNLGMCMYGTRGFAKSTALASVTAWLNLIKPNGVTSIIGGNDTDLKSISRLIKIGIQNLPSVFAVPTVVNDWNSEVELGLELKKGKMIHSYISITNGANGSGSGSEKGAGLSPVGWIADEIGKWDVSDILESALPSFTTGHGAKLVHILSGTAGNIGLSKDAKKILQNPKAYRLLPMNFEKLDRSVPEEAITWNESRKDKFCMFVPGQMSHRLEAIKKPRKLSEYLGVKSEELDKIQINCTDWTAATRWIENELSSKADEKSRDKVRMYYPMKIGDIFLAEGVNPFPTAVIQRRIDELVETGKVGKTIDLNYQDGKFTEDFSTKKKAPIKYEGGIEDAPIMLFGRLPDKTPEKYENISGLDHYKLDGAAEDGSLGSMYVLRRRNLEINSPCEKVIASYAARPDTHKELNVNFEKMVKCWNAECNVESIDTSFIQFLDAKGIAQDYLCPSFSFVKATSRKANKPLNSRYGLYPTVGNKQVRWNTLVEWSKEQHVVGIGEDGNEIVKLSVEFQDDIDLLQEMLDYKKGGNFDRLDAFSHALVYAKLLDKDDVAPIKTEVKTQKLNKSSVRKSSPFSSRRSNPYR